MKLLQTEKMGINFGGLKAVEDVSISVSDNEIVGLIGPNGAGKTTIFNLLTGVYKPTQGSIYINGVETSRLKTYQISDLGISRTFQNIRLFRELSVIDNVKIALDSKSAYNSFDAILRTKKYREIETEKTKKSMEILKIFDLDNLANQRADNLSYGQQRKLEIARALATNPKILLLDEPAAGMNPQETRDLMEIIGFIKNKFSVSILLIEHDMNLVMGICDRLYVLNFGRLIAQGKPKEIQNNPSVISAYLGE